MKIKNSYYEGLLQDLFCGNDGFFTIFMHFLYQNNQIFVFYPSFSKDFEKLVSLELESCNTLSRVINEMGGDSKYYSSSKKYIFGKIDYVKNLESIVDLDLELVEKSLIDTKNVLSKVDNHKIKNQLENILSIKKEEEKILKNIKFNLFLIKNNKKC